MVRSWGLPQPNLESAEKGRKQRAVRALEEAVRQKQKAQLLGDSQYFHLSERCRKLLGRMLVLPTEQYNAVDLSYSLSRQDIFVAVRANHLRMTPHLYNTEQHIDRFCEALRSLL